MATRGKSRRAVMVLGAALLVLALLGAPAAALGDEAEQIYQPGAMVEIELTLSAEAEQSLEEEPGKDVKGTFSAWLTDGTPGGSKTVLTTAHPVELHLKGHVGGSFEPLTGKAAFKLKFKKTERFLGLRKMTLNNMVEDPSMLHETLAYALFRAAGVPAPRTGFAYLRVNGADYGVYLDLESLDETALARLYGAGNTLHLYEGEYGADADAASVATVNAVVAEGEPKFEMDEGEGEPADLEALAAAVEAPSPSFSARTNGLADLDEMTRMWAVEKYISHWDGYSGEAAANKPNNYYLHSDLSGLFQMIPWGTDNTWQIERRIGFDGPAGLLFNGCLGDPECFDRYVAALRALQGQVAALDPDGLAASTAALLKPWQELEEAESSRGLRDVAEIEAAVAKVRQYISERPDELGAWLAANAPEPPAEEKPPAEETGGGGTANTGSTGKTPSPPKPSGPPAVIPDLRVVDLVKRSGQLRLRALLLAPGRVRAWASISTPNGRRRACAADVTTDTAGTVVLPCRFSNLVRERLRHRGLRMRLVIRLDPVEGPPETTIRQVRLPRQ